jgi:hypothetical protein
LVIEGTGEAVAKVEVATAFAFLADPYHGRLWFASAAPLEPPGRPIAPGLTWRLEKTQQTRRVLPLKMVTYQPPECFVWATQLGGLSTNHIWEVHLRPGPESGTTTISMALRLRPGPIDRIATLIAPARLRRSLATSAQGAIDRACEVLEAQEQVTRQGRTHEMKPGGKLSRHRRRENSRSQKAR